MNLKGKIYYSKACAFTHTYARSLFYLKIFAIIHINRLYDRAYIFVIGFIFFDLSKYNKNVVKKHKNSNKSVKECVYGTIDFE